MPVKNARGKSPTKPRSASRSPKKTKTKGAVHKKKKGSSGSKRKVKTPTRAPVVDPKSKVAMENAYYICHSAAHFLEMRGFPYGGTKCKGGKKGKKGGKGKKKKK